MSLKILLHRCTTVKRYFIYLFFYTYIIPNFFFAGIDANFFVKVLALQGINCNGECITAHAEAQPSQNERGPAGPEA